MVTDAGRRADDRHRRRRGLRRPGARVPRRARHRGPHRAQVRAPLRRRCRPTASTALAAFAADVRGGRFPADGESYHLTADVAETARALRRAPDDRHSGVHRRPRFAVPRWPDAPARSDALRPLLAAALVLAAGRRLGRSSLRGADQPADPYFERCDGRDPPVGRWRRAGDPARIRSRGLRRDRRHGRRAAGGGDLLAWCLAGRTDPGPAARGLMEVTTTSAATTGWLSSSTRTSDRRLLHAQHAHAAVDRLLRRRRQRRVHRRHGAVRGPRRLPDLPARRPVPVRHRGRQGGLDELGITPGATVSIGGACTARLGRRPPWLRPGARRPSDARRGRASRSAVPAHVRRQELGDARCSEGAVTPRG